MKIFKFGGASIRDAASVKRVASVLKQFPGEDILIVVSAMGKTTNALEKLTQHYLEGHQAEVKAQLEELQNAHLAVIQELFPGQEPSVSKEVEVLFTQLEVITQRSPEGHFNEVYDQIVSFGELLSTKIVGHYLHHNEFANQWLDARRLIRTDQNHRFARVDWNFTQRLVRETIRPGQRYITQGFIGSTDDYRPTTLGREGSDYTASVLAYVLDAAEVSIWKDVPGVLNGDPKVFEKTQLLRQISYEEAIELAYYGASVIHPKTIQPLRQKGIPLRVRSFLAPETPGTRIYANAELDPVIPCFIRKENQVLLTLATRDLAFIVEDHLSRIYKLFHQYGVRVNLSQNTAVSTSFCINYDPVSVPPLREELSREFAVQYQPGLCLYTVRHHHLAARERVQAAGALLMEQLAGHTYQVVINPGDS
jgi:aspartate kinase